MRRYISTEPVRLCVVRAKVTDDEKKALSDVARARSLSVAELIRSLIADRPHAA